MARTGRPKIDDPHNYKLTVCFSNEQKKRLEAYAEKFSLSKAQVLMKGFDNSWRGMISPKRASNGRLFLTSDKESEEKVWLKQERILAAMRLRPARVREKADVTPIPGQTGWENAR